MGEARKTIVAAQPAGFGEFGGGTLALAFAGISRRGIEVMKRGRRVRAASVGEPNDRLVGARLQQMHDPNPPIKSADVGIAGAEADGLLHERDSLLYRPGEELA